MYVSTNKDKLLAYFTGTFQSVIVSSVACWEITSISRFAFLLVSFYLDTFKSSEDWKLKSSWERLNRDFNASFHICVLKSHPGKYFLAAGLAQSVERLTAEREVTDSIPILRVLKSLRNDGTPFAPQAVGPSRGSDNQVKWRSRLPWKIVSPISTFVLNAVTLK